MLQQQVPTLGTPSFEYSTASFITRFAVEAVTISRLCVIDLAASARLAVKTYTEVCRIMLNRTTLMAEIQRLALILRELLGAFVQIESAIAISCYDERHRNHYSREPWMPVPFLVVIGSLESNQSRVETVRTHLILQKAAQLNLLVAHDT